MYNICETVQIVDNNGPGRLVKNVPCCHFYLITLISVAGRRAQSLGHFYELLLLSRFYM